MVVPSGPESSAARAHVRVVSPARDPVSMDEVYARYARYVGAVAFRLLGKDEEVDDAVQEVFVRAVHAWDRLEDRGAVKGWLASITVRVVSRKLRVRRARRLLWLDRDYDYERVPGPGASPDQVALLKSVYSALDDLRVADRTAWLLRHVEGQTLPEVARSCGCSLATAKRRIAAAQTWLEGRVRHG